ncbi:MAG: hypothetical protein JXR34_11920 [Bacteroidales bacterium]|nr:hypothetical protein [Bacteroidales bacterium]
MLCSENERFKLFFDTLNISQKNFSSIIGLSIANVNAWLNDRTHITGEGQVRILKKYKNLDARWFLFGEGTFKSETESVGEPTVNYKQQSNPDDMNTFISELFDQLKQKDEQIRFLQDQLRNYVDLVNINKLQDK